MCVNKLFFNKDVLIKIFNIIKSKSKINFIESIDVAINLFIDTKDVDQNVKGSVLLPYNFNKKKKIIVFAPKSKENIAYSSGAFLVGMEDLFDKVKNNLIDYDIVISTLEAVKLVSKLGQILGPKGLMPNLKFGTITNNLEKTILEFMKGKVTYKNDKFGIIHSVIGKINFTSDQLLENFICLINSVKFNKPNKLKSSIFFKKIVISSTMGKGFLFNFNSI